MLRYRHANKKQKTATTTTITISRCKPKDNRRKYSLQPVYIVFSNQNLLSVIFTHLADVVEVDGNGNDCYSSIRSCVNFQQINKFIYYDYVPRFSHISDICRSLLIYRNVFGNAPDKYAFSDYWPLIFLRFAKWDIQVPAFITFTYGKCLRTIFHWNSTPFIIKKQRSYFKRYLLRLYSYLCLHSSDSVNNAITNAATLISYPGLFLDPEIYSYSYISVNVSANEVDFITYLSLHTGLSCCAWYNRWDIMSIVLDNINFDEFDDDVFYVMFCNAMARGHFVLAEKIIDWRKRHISLFFNRHSSISFMYIWNLKEIFELDNLEKIEAAFALYEKIRLADIDEVPEQQLRNEWQEILDVELGGNEFFTTNISANDFEVSNLFNIFSNDMMICRTILLSLLFCRAQPVVIDYFYSKIKSEDLRRKLLSAIGRRCKQYLKWYTANNNELDHAFSVGKDVPIADGDDDWIVRRYSWDKGDFVEFWDFGGYVFIAYRWYERRFKMDYTNVGNGVNDDFILVENINKLEKEFHDKLNCYRESLKLPISRRPEQIRDTYLISQSAESPSTIPTWWKLALQEYNIKK